MSEPRFETTEDATNYARQLADSLPYWAVRNGGRYCESEEEAQRVKAGRAAKSDTQINGANDMPETDTVTKLRAVTEDNMYIEPWTTNQLCFEAANEIEKLRSDRLLLAQFIARVTPDRNTQTEEQTEEEADAVEDEVARIVREAQQDAKSRIIKPST